MRPLTLEDLNCINVSELLLHFAIALIMEVDFAENLDSLESSD